MFFRFHNMVRNKPILTIVIPVYNREKIVVRTLNYIAAQDTREFDLVIVDNNSSDETLSAVRQWADRNKDINTKILSESRRGAAAARNCGLANVTTEFVMFFDSDDYMAPTHVSSAIETIKDNPGVELVGWDCKAEQRDGSFRKQRFVTEHAMMHHLVLGCLSTFRYAAKTELVRRAGGWDESMKVWDDYELGVRILLEKPIIAKRKGKALVKSFWSDVSLTATTFADHAGDYEHPLNTIENHLKQCYPKLLGWIDYRRAILAAFYSMDGDEDAAKRLMKIALSGKTNSLVVKFIYHWHRRVHRGAWLIARYFLPKD